MLEPCEGKLSRTVLRGESGSNTADLLDQLIENKQKFISQIMTSKSPVRSCEDVDETALSYAEVKALATGNPAVKEKMSLDVEVSKLKLLKANHMSNQYRLEDSIAKKFPQQIAEITEKIKGLEEDIAYREAMKNPGTESFSMEISGKNYTEKKEAGAALLTACSMVKKSWETMDIGEYEGFRMLMAYDALNSEFVLRLKRCSTIKMRVGSDAMGNITRINNVLEKLPQFLQEQRQKLDVVESQLESAKKEAGKPFPKEEELAEKLERLSELNALLNMDEKEDPDIMPGGEKSMGKGTETTAKGEVLLPSSGDRMPDEKLRWMSRDEIETTVLLRTRELVIEQGIDAQVLAARVYGSRTKDGMYGEDSDLDVVVYYKGSIREEDFFSALNSGQSRMNGMKLDINPINEEKSVSLEDFMRKSTEYLESKKAPVVHPERNSQMYTKKPGI